MSTAQLLLNEFNLRTLTYPTPSDMCAEKIPLVLMGGERRVKRAQTRERGSPSAPAELSLHFLTSKRVMVQSLVNNFSF